MRYGRHTLQVAASTQATVALSSGEAEFYASVRTACRTLGCAALARDMGVQLTARLGTDSSAAKGLASRRGVGSVRHIATPALWLQDAVEAKRLDLRKLAGKANPADLGYKGAQWGRYPAVFERPKSPSGDVHHGSAFEGRSLSGGYAALSAAVDRLRYHKRLSRRQRVALSAEEG